MDWLHRSLRGKFARTLGLVVSLSLVASACAPGTTLTPGPGGTPSSPTTTSPTPKVTPSVTPSPTPTTAPLPAGQGTLEVRVTDPPPPKSIDHVLVTVESLEVHIAGDNWTTMSVNASAFDLKALEGIEAFLGSQLLASGKYTQIRLGVKSVIIETEGKKVEASVPSDKIKLVGNFEVAPGKTTVITLDFDGEKSVVETGQGKYQFKPVIKLLVREPGEKGEKEKPRPAEEKEDKLNITTTTLPNGQVGVAYSANLTATGGKKPYTWSILSGSLPTGLTLGTATGNITGTPGVAVSANFTVQIKDSAEKQNTDNQTLSILIN